MSSAGKCVSLRGAKAGLHSATASVDMRGAAVKTEARPPSREACHLMRYSAFAIVREALRGNRHWAPVWRDPEPKPSYDVVIIGGGGHGLATAYYLAKEHG